MPGFSTLLAFALAAAVLIIIPGPAVLYVVARSLDQGRLAGLVSVLGIAVGALVHTAAAALGISAILATSAVAFALVKYLGAAYLIYLGLTTLFKQEAHPQEMVTARKPLGRIFGQGIIVNVLNPKSALFFLAFLPQFVDPGRGPVAPQMILLGLIFVTIALLSDGLYALLAGQLGGWLKRSPRVQARQRYFSGTVYIALGLLTAVAGSGKSS